MTAVMWGVFSGVALLGIVAVALDVE